MDPEPDLDRGEGLRRQRVAEAVDVYLGFHQGEGEP